MYSILKYTYISLCQASIQSVCCVLYVCFLNLQYQVPHCWLLYQVVLLLKIKHVVQTYSTVLEQCCSQV